MDSTVSEPRELPIKAVLFDTFGTVVDWRTGIADAAGEFFHLHDIRADPHAFADAWRSRYEPAMQPIRSGMRGFTKLTVLHRENLMAVFEEMGVSVAGIRTDEIDDLNRAWERLPPWPDSIEGLRRLKPRYVIGPLSNGNVGLLTRMAKSAGLPWDVIVGADISRAYKPDPEAYLRAADLLELSPPHVMLAAAHNSDLKAARAAGLATAFVARPTEFGSSQRVDLQPESDWTLVSSSITELAAQLSE